MVSPLLKAVPGKSAASQPEPLAISAYWKEDDPLKRKPSIKLAQDLFNWQPNIDIHEGLQKTINHIMN